MSTEAANNPLKYMKLYTINISIRNDIGELTEKTLVFPTLDDMSLTIWKEGVIDKVIEDAREYATNNNMLVEELYDSKEDAEFNEEDTYDGSSKIDLINSDESFQ